MRDAIPKSYAALLEMLCDQGVVTAAEATRLRRLIKTESSLAIGFTAHELLRAMARDGRLDLRAGRLDHHCSAIRVADSRRGQIYSLPALLGPAQPFVRTPQNPELGPPPSFSTAQIAQLFQEQSRHTLSSVERSADVKGIVTGILNLMRNFLAAPVALCFTQTLPAPGALAVGLDHLYRRGESPERSEETILAGLPRTWQTWLDTAVETPDAMLYLPDMNLLPVKKRPLEHGSALLVPIRGGGGAWEAVLVAAIPRPFQFGQEKLARMRMFIAHFCRQLNYAVRLQSVISYDFLTAVYNRNFFEDQLGRVIAGAARKDQSFALIILDIDDFKQFNTRYGYDAGDRVLRAVAGTLKGALRTTDVLARYGGEEFAILLAPPVSPREAAVISERLRSAVESLVVHVPTLTGTPHRVSVTASAGGALFPADGSERNSLWSTANRMLLAAKARGKNRVHFPPRRAGGGHLHVVSD